MLVLDIRGNARDGSVPKGNGVAEEITGLTPASPSHGTEFVRLHLREVRSGAERTRFSPARLGCSKPRRSPKNRIPDRCW